MRIRGLVILGIFVIGVSGFASADLVTNSEEWKDNSIVIAKSHFADEEVHAVTSLGEGQIISEMLLDNRSHTVYEPEDPDTAVWENFDNFLQNEGLQDVDSSPLDWQESQYEFYEEHQDDVEGIVVIQPDFTMDIISVFPQVVNADYWPIYYDGEDTQEFLESDLDDEEVIFYGEFLEQPWRTLPDNHDHRVLSEDSREQNNRGLVREVTENHDRESVIVAGDSYLERGFMKKGDPVILARDVDATANLINDLDFEAVEVIGGENVDFGDTLQDRISENTTVIAKFGRRFTGAEGLDSTFPVKQIPGEPIIRDISVDSVKYAEDTETVEIVFENEGTIETPITFSAISLSGNGGEEIISEDQEIVTRPDRKTTLHFNSSMDFDPQTAEVSFGYEGASGISSRSYQVETVDSWEASEIELESFYYHENAEEIHVEVANEGDENVYTGAHMLDLNLLDRTVQPVTDEVAEIEPGDSETLTVAAYMSEEDLEENNPLSLAVTAGDTVDTAQDLYLFEQTDMEVREGGVLVIIVQYGPILIILLLLLLLLYYLKRRRDKQKYRGLK